MTDVARLAGVSHMTVSRVLNGHPNVRESTRDRVAAAIEQLEYRRNSAARALVTNRTQTLGVVAFDTTLYGPASTLFGIEQAAREAGYFVTIVSLKQITRESVAQAVEHLTSQSVDGLVVIAPQEEAVEALTAVPAGLPVVAVEGGSAPDLPLVCVDQAEGATQATQHLLDLGHETVWHVAGPPDWLEAVARRDAWRATLERAAATVRDPLPGDWSPRSGYEAGKVLAQRDDVTAVFVGNDQMALGLLRAFGEAGVEVPGQVSVVGFDDIPESAYFSPPLTTVHQDFTEVGRGCIRVLLDQIVGEVEAPVGTPRLVVPTELVARASTAPPAHHRRGASA
ncbi:MAG TPA: LacI family DNA-binding transcriptional regulator [Nocardioidaceae bacterium]